MPQAYDAPLAPDLSLYAGCIVRLTALSPTDGSHVSGVTVSNVSLFVTNLTGGIGHELESGLFRLVPGPGA